MSQILEKLGNRKLVIASSSEPYLHFYHGGNIRWRGGAGGVATAFDSLMQAYGGTWVALGLGTADKDVIDKNGKIAVPPEKGKYTLKRVLITKKEEEGFLALSSNSAIWPLSHVAYVRPKFSKDAWEQYKNVNKKIAESVAEEVDENALVWLNDYHLSLCGKYLREIKPGVPTGFFWHIPWPSLEVSKICPWQEEILQGLLSNRLVGFHIPQYVKNFLYAAEKTIGAEVDWQRGIVKYGGETTKVMALPIGIDSTGISSTSASITHREIANIRKKYNAAGRKLIVGVDRMDYTKGIPEKIKAVDFLLMQNPRLVGKVTLVQIAAPTRINLPEYAKTLQETLETADSVNWKYMVGDWQPVILVNDFVPLSDIIPLYKAADVCLVTSLQDGMNLVSKEFVASNDGTGVLVLSKFAGSAEELSEAIMVNPYLTEDIAGGVERALNMDEKEKLAKMAALKQKVLENDVFKWAASFISELAKEQKG